MQESWFIVNLTNYRKYRETMINYFQSRNIQYTDLNKVEMFTIYVTELQVFRIQDLNYVEEVIKDIEILINLDSETTNNNSQKNEKIKPTNRMYSDDNDIENWGITYMNVPCLWNRSITGKGVKVAVLDTGIGPREGIKVVQSVTFVDGTTTEDTNGHGTEVASLIVGVEDYALYKAIYGVAYDCDLYSVKVIQPESEDLDYGYISPILKGINWCIENNMKIINVGFTIDRELIGSGTTRFLVKAFQKAIDKGILVVCPMGNRGKEETLIPVIVEGVFAIGSFNQNNKRSEFSNFGANISFVAAGENVEVMSLGTSIKTSNGTSLAAAQVSGVMALMLSQNPNLKPFDIGKILAENAQQIFGEGYNIFTGNGAVKAPISSAKRSIAVNSPTVQVGEAGSINAMAQDEEDIPIVNLDVDVTITHPDKTTTVHPSKTNKEGEVNIVFVTDHDSVQSDEIVLNQIGNYKMEGVFKGVCCNCQTSKPPTTNLEVKENKLSGCITNINCTCYECNICIKVKNSQGSTVKNVDIEIISHNKILQKGRTNENGVACFKIPRNRCCYNCLLIKMSKDGYKSASINYPLC